MSRRGIEVGNTFKLGTKYSKALGATVLDEEGNERVLIMGSYGIGITRTAQAAVERFHDDHGIVWPVPIAPLHCHLVCVNSKDEALARAAEELYETLTEARIEVLYDDRAERPGVKFADADLIGLPWRITVGSKGLAQGAFEVKRRDEEKAQLVPAEEIVSNLREAIRQATP